MVTSFIHKSGKHTPGIGYFWSGCAGRALRGIEILGLSVIDANARLSFHLDAVQTPPLNTATAAITRRGINSQLGSLNFNGLFKQ